MAVFGPISSSAPNVMFDPASAMGAAQAYQRNQLLMEHAKQDQSAQQFERDATARIGLARRMADLPDDQLAAAWGPEVQRLQAAGLGQGIDPSAPPPRERLKAIAASDLTTFQKMQGEHLARSDEERAQYHQGMLGLQQQQLGQTAAHQAASLRQSAAHHAAALRQRQMENGIELIPVGVPAAAPTAAGGTMSAPAAPAAPGPQLGEAAPAPEAGGVAARLGGVDVAGPGAPPAPAPAGPPPGTRLMFRNGAPITTGLPTGQAWGVDANGARIPVDIPGVKTKPAEAAPLIPGNGLDAGLLNILVTGDPSTPQYAAAFARLGAEEVLPSGMTRRPDMSPFRAPTYRPPGVVEAGTPAIPQGGRQFGRAEVGEAPPPGPSANDRTKLKQIEIEASGIMGALDEFTTTRSKAGVGERAASAAGLPTELNSTYNNAALLAKGQALYDLGVLNGPDLDIIRRTLADPGTIRGAAASQSTVEAQARRIKNLIDQRLTAAREQYGGAKPAAPRSLMDGAEPPSAAPRERPPLSSFGR